jgi:ethanolamine ammonia-lyase small subunit
MDLPVIQSQAREINEHLTRPDLGRKLPPESVDFIKRNCKMNPQVQIYVSDGLSNSAIDENIREILPALMDGLKHRGIETGTPFFVRFGRVPTMDVISEITGADVTVVLLGERPGLAAADSMSAYMAYKATVGMPESRRTVVSNIHKNGIQPVEAGAYLVEIIEKMLKTKSSGVDLVL